MNKFNNKINEYLQESVRDGLIVHRDGSKVWYKDDKLHRLNGPAIEWADGTKEWYKDDKLHRSDGPAIERADGNKRWYKDDKLHRLDGPAVERADGTKEWFINGNELSEKEFNDYLKRQEIAKEITGHKNNRIDPGMLEDYL